MRMELAVRRRSSPASEAEYLWGPMSGSSIPNSPRVSVTSVLPSSNDAAPSALPAAERRSSAHASDSMAASLPGRASVEPVGMPAAVPEVEAPRQPDLAERRAALALVLKRHASGLITSAQYDDSSSIAHASNALVAAGQAIRDLLALGVPYVQIRTEFRAAVLATLGILSPHRLKTCDEAGFAQFMQKMHPAHPDIIERELAGVLVELDIHQLYRDARDADHAKKKGNLGLSLVRGMKEVVRDVDAKVGARHKFVELLAKRKATHELATLHTTASVTAFAAAEPGKKLEAAGRGLEGLLKILPACATPADFARHLQAALLLQDPASVHAYAQQLDDPKIMKWLTPAQKGLFGAIQDSFARVAAVAPPSGADVAEFVVEGRPRDVSADGKVSPDMPNPIARPEQIAASRVRGAAMGLGMALTIGRDMSTGQLKSLDTAFAATCSAVHESLADRNLPGQSAFALVREGVRRQFDGVDAHAVKNAQESMDWLRLKARNGNVVERNVAVGILDLNVEQVHRQKRNDEHARNAANPSGTADRLVQPLRTLARAMKNAGRAIDKSYLHGKEVLDDRAADLALRSGLNATADKSLAATGLVEEDRDEALIVGIAEFVEFELPPGPADDESARLLAHMEDALIRKPVGDVVKLGRALADTELRKHLTDLFNDIDPTLIPRLGILARAVSNVAAIYRNERRPTIN